MVLITNIDNPVTIYKPVITIGTFDGIHTGHRAILKRVKERAAATGSDSAVVTFHPHPRIVLGQEVKLLNTREEKRRIIEEAGISHLIEIPFTVSFSDLSADEFIKLLVEMLSPSTIIIGYDHGFGRNREGDLAQLQELGNHYGFDVINVEPVQIEGNKVSSSHIRSLLSNGKVREASIQLGEPYSLSGTVVRGNQIGKRLGYPTANLYVEDENKLIPRMGVYASLVEFNGKEYLSMTNIGLRPTLDTNRLTIEANLFDFDGDMYYKKMTLKLVERIRDEKRFTDLDCLMEQIGRDKEISLKILTS